MNTNESYQPTQAELDAHRAAEYAREVKNQAEYDRKHPTAHQACAGRTSQRMRDLLMNTTPGTITNPTAVNLARIVHHAEQMYEAAQDNSCRCPTRAEREAFQSILHAVAAIATRNGNDPADILEHASDIVDQNGIAR